MSRRKKSATVQSATTRSFRESERQLVQVVRPGHEPAEEAAQREAEHVGDPLVAAERRDLAEHAVAVRLGVAGQVLREPSGLAERVLGGRRVGPARCRPFGTPRAVAERPDVRRGPRRGASSSTGTRPRSSSGRPSSREQRVRPHPGVQTSVCVGIRVAVGEDDARPARPTRASSTTWISTPRPRAAARRSRRAGVGISGRIFGARVDEHPALRRAAQLGVVAQRVPHEVGQLGERLDARVAGADEDERQLPLGAVGVGAAAAASSRRRTWLRRWIASARSLKPSPCSARPGIGRVRETAPSATHELLVPRPRAARRRSRPCTRPRRCRARSTRPSRSSACGHISRSGTTMCRGSSVPEAASGQQRREEHEVLGADDRAPRVAEQPRDVRAGEPPPRISVPPRAAASATASTIAAAWRSGRGHRQRGGARGSAPRRSAACSPSAAARWSREGWAT